VQLSKLFGLWLIIFVFSMVDALGVEVRAIAIGCNKYWTAVTPTHFTVAIASSLNLLMLT
jgi:hypothetical protein